MRKLSLLVALAALALLPSAQAAVGGDASLPKLPPVGAAEAPLFAGGGTPVTNGVFFPGTALCNGSTCYGEPYEIAKGTDVRLYNLDTGLVANSHGIVSKATKKKTGGPLFQSDTFGGPGSVLMKTSHLKPGVYEYFCRVHFGMMGFLEVTG